MELHSLFDAIITNVMTIHAFIYYYNAFTNNR